MCFRIKLVQQFSTMISQKLSPDNLFGWSRTSENMRDGKAVNVPRTKRLREHPLLGGREAPREHAAPWPRSGLVPPGAWDFTHPPGNKTSQLLGPYYALAPPQSASPHSEQTRELQQVKVNL